MFPTGDIITAPATATGGALSLIRLSGEGSIALCDSLFRGRCRLTEAPSHTLHYGTLEADGEPIDEVVVSLFRAPHSYTGEESVEISCHGSRYITRRLLQALIARGARMASAGEFTQRAFLNGRLDLSQAEAVGDLIAAESRAAHRLASRQIRGEYSSALNTLREELLRLCALVELELDFSEEEVTFASRSDLEEHICRISAEVERLRASFSLGNALKEGVMVAIVGAPNVGKSTLLNRLVGEDRAMVSEIAGTTRDTIEEIVHIDDLLFRFIDTAGLHDTQDRLEQMGIARTHATIARAQIVLHLLDANNPDSEPLTVEPHQQVLRLYNKVDTLSMEGQASLQARGELLLSAKEGEGLETLRHRLREMIDTTGL
ncbi:MAG: tRNA uridine-5-carboxymethylaminomethyl(34) synthesis GTPase MnmE, partial [Alistipes sp.]|nr:tRNA uridine-5-carboxymethylaminomethyl(34) synthesis GTPase MnmE [Alistipes sp.]